MNTLIIVAQKALPVFVMLALGMLCRKTKMISREGVAAMKTFAVNITLPAVMLNAFATASYSRESLIVPLVIFSMCVLMLLGGHLLCRMMKIPGRLSPYLATGFEAGMLGYALFALLFPQESASAFAMVDLGQVLFVFTLYKALLAGSSGLRGVIHEALHAPTVWAIAAGILIGASGLYGALAPSGLSGVLALLRDNDISIEYLYSFVRKVGNDAIIIFRVDQPDRAGHLLLDNGIRLLEQDEIA